MQRLLWLCALAGLLSGCALRPTYKAFVTPTTPGPEVKLMLVDKATGAPLPNVKIEMSEFKSRYSTITGADGSFALPVDKKYLDENPMVVVAVPTGVRGYEVRTPPPPAQPALPAEPPPPAAVPDATEPVKM